MLIEWVFDDQSLGLNDSSVGLHHFFSLSVNIEEVFDLPDHSTKDSREATEAVEATVACDNLGKSIGGSAVSRVVDLDGASAH